MQENSFEDTINMLEKKTTDIVCSQTDPKFQHDQQKENLNSVKQSLNQRENCSNNNFQEKENAQMEQEQQAPNSQDISQEQKQQQIQQQITTAKKQMDQEFDPQSAHIVITVCKQHQIANKKTYTLQNDKITGSSLSQKNQIQIIRRKKQQQPGESNIDLGLASNESAADKVPAIINTEYGFRYARLPTLEMKYIHLKRAEYPLNRLPLNVFTLINSFLRPQPKLSIIDCGTNLKTFVRVQKEKLQAVKELNNYLIGSDFFFHVKQINKAPQEQKKKKLTEVESTEYFYQTLVREQEKQRCQVHGLNAQEMETFNKYINEYRQLKKKGKKQYSLENCNRPFIKIQFDTPHLKSCVTFVAKFGEKKQFKIGRSQDCDIIVNLNTVSRKQTQIIFENDQWFIRDGEGSKGSANGTWQALQQFEHPLANKTPRNSDPLQIEDQMEIKISENIFKFEFVNFGVHKRRKLTNELFKELTNFN